LLDATVGCLLELGYQGTTTAAVQERAGLSRGALMHHYASKEELLVAAVRHLGEQRGANLRRQAALLPDDDDRISQAIDLLWDTFTGPLFTATLELWSAARTDPELRVALLDSERGLRADLGAAMEELFGPRVASEPEFAAAIELTLQFLRGAALTAILRTNGQRQRHVIERWKSIFAQLVTNRIGA
jgi:AcrR family transcriptional regulator